jgi:hypothetical protein
MAIAIAKDHSHYSASTQAALRDFQSVWTSYSNMTWLQLRDNAFRVDSVQSAWNRLVRARKAETGSGLYLTPEQYKRITLAK